MEKNKLVNGKKVTFLWAGEKKNGTIVDVKESDGVFMYDIRNGYDVYRGVPENDLKK